MNTPNGDKSMNILKSNVYVHLPYVTNMINLPIKEGFPDEFKLAEVSLKSKI